MVGVATLSTYRKLPKIDLAVLPRLDIRNATIGEQFPVGVAHFVNIQETTQNQPRRFAVFGNMGSQDRREISGGRCPFILFHRKFCNRPRRFAVFGNMGSQDRREISGGRCPLIGKIVF